MSSIAHKSFDFCITAVFYWARKYPTGAPSFCRKESKSKMDSVWKIWKLGEVVIHLMVSQRVVEGWKAETIQSVSSFGYFRVKYSRFQSSLMFDFESCQVIFFPLVEAKNFGCRLSKESNYLKKCQNFTVAMQKTGQFGCSMYYSIPNSRHWETVKEKIETRSKFKKKTWSWHLVSVESSIWDTFTIVCLRKSFKWNLLLRWRQFLCGKISEMEQVLTISRTSEQRIWKISLDGTLILSSIPSKVFFDNHHIQKRNRI